MHGIPTTGDGRLLRARGGPRADARRAGRSQRFKTSSVRGGPASGSGGAFGVGFAVLSTLALRIPVRAQLALPHQAKRRSASAPWARGSSSCSPCWRPCCPSSSTRVEGRGFSSFVGARHVRATKSGFLTVISRPLDGRRRRELVRALLGDLVMGGFSHDLKRKILGNNAHIVVDVDAPRRLRRLARRSSRSRVALAPTGGGAATPVVGGEAMASSSSNTAGVARARHRSRRPSATSSTSRRTSRSASSTTSLAAPRSSSTSRRRRGRRHRPRRRAVLHGPDFRNAPRRPTPSLREFLEADREGLPRASSSAASSPRRSTCYVGDEVTLVSPLGDLGPMGDDAADAQVPRRRHLLQRDVRVRRDARLRRCSTTRRASSA